jgi:hypothetical protein
LSVTLNAGRLAMTGVLPRHQNPACLAELKKE